MNRIRELREDRDLSQTEIAKILKTTQQQYSKIETGRSDISGEKLKLLAEFYQVSADYILGLPEGLSYPKR
ncbi:MAG: helix-turn-helix transcriptional regulator [Clostridia bacterium]|nr:helix-turn-helix transcriptional regulator [Clostridia bacterium]